MKKTYVHALYVLLATVISACGHTDTADMDRETQSPPPSTSSSVVPADLLQTVEKIGAELDLRQSVGALSGEWAEVWSNAQGTRQQSEIKDLIARIQRASPRDELTAKSDVLERYFQSYDPVIRLLDQQHANGTLDAKLTELRAGVQGAQVSAQRTFCCRVTLWSGEVNCHEWDTFGVWATRKCMGLLPWTASERRLEKTSCSNVPGCG